MIKFKLSKNNKLRIRGNKSVLQAEEVNLLFCPFICLDNVIHHSMCVREKEQYYNR